MARESGKLQKSRSTMDRCRKLCRFVNQAVR